MVEIHLESRYWNDPTAARQPTVKEISTQLSWLRVSSRGVKVPTGLSKARRADLLKALVEVLEGLDVEKVQRLYALNVAERQGAVTSHNGEGAPHTVVGTAGEELSESDEDEDD